MADQALSALGLGEDEEAEEAARAAAAAAAAARDADKKKAAAAAAATDAELLGVDEAGRGAGGEAAGGRRFDAVRAFADEREARRKVMVAMGAMSESIRLLLGNSVGGGGWDGLACYRPLIACFAPPTHTP